MKQPNSKHQLFKDIVVKGSTTKRDVLNQLSPSALDEMNYIRFYYKIGDLYYGKGSTWNHRIAGETPEQTSERWKQKHEGKTRQELKELSAQGYRVIIIVPASEKPI